MRWLRNMILKNHVYKMDVYLGVGLIYNTDHIKMENFFGEAGDTAIHAQQDINFGHFQAQGDTAVE